MSPSLTLLPRPRVRDRVAPLRHVVVPVGAADLAAEALAAVLLDADADADAVLLVDAGVTVDPAAVRAALEVVAADDAVDVVAWREAGDPAVCWAALLPLDALRAVGLTHAGLTRVLLADLVLRAQAAGFLAVDARSGATAVRPLVPTVRDRVLLAMLHEPIAARTRVVRASLTAEARSLVGRRWAEVAVRHRDVAAVLVAADADERAALLAGSAAVLPAGVVQQAVSLHVRLWLDWSRLRRLARAAAFEQAAPEGWAARSRGGVESAADTLPSGEQGTARSRRHDVRWRPWSTTRRGTSAA